jgi:DHA2 family multidrug resistance protein
MTHSERAAITISVMLAGILQSLDTTIANVALPHIRGSLSATSEQMGWVLTSYIIASAIMTPLSGWLAKRYGRRNVMLCSIVGFTLTSGLCGLAQSLPELVLSRLLQGACGAALMPLSQAVLLDINPPERHGRAMAVWSMAALLGPILGPTLGGWVTDNFSWRWIFYINLPLGLLCAMAVWTFLRESEKKAYPFDLFGFVTLSVGIGTLQLMLDRAEILDWFNSTEICIEAGVTLLACYLFVVHSLTSDRPFVDPRLFKDANFAVSCVFIFIIGVVIFSTMTLLPPMLQDQLGYPVTLSGIVMSPRGIGAFISMFIIGKVVNRVDTRMLIGIGLVMTAASLSLMCRLSPQMDSHIVMWSGFLQGLGTGAIFVPLATVAFGTLAPQYRSDATAIFGLLRNVGSSIGISIVQVVLSRNTQIMHARLSEHISRFGQFGFQSRYDLSSTRDVVALNASVTRQATFIAYNNDFKMLLVMTLAVLPMLLILRTSSNVETSDTPVLVE